MLNTGEHFDAVILRHVSPENGLWVELRNPRLANGVEVNTQDVVRCQWILDDYNVQETITFNSNMMNPIRFLLPGKELQEEITGCITGINMLLAIEELVKWFEVTCYFDNGDTVYIVDRDMHYTIERRGVPYAK